MTPTDAITRARSMIGRGVRYRLGAGGLDPTSPSPANMAGQCDCSGFVAWVLGISRKTTHPWYVTFNGGWINTDAIVADTTVPVGLFAPLTAPRPGALVVFPARPPKRKVGHVGIIATITNAQIASVVHCSKGNDTKTKDAIRETPPTVFTVPDAVIAWYAGF